MPDQTRENGLTRGNLARVTGCNIETIRYYEKTGLLPDPPRTAAGYRAYSSTHATRLRFILRARELGFSMENIRELMGIDNGAPPTCAEVKETTDRHLANIRAKIADLQRIETSLWQPPHGARVRNLPIVRYSQQSPRSKKIPRKAEPRNSPPPTTRNRIGATLPQQRQNKEI